MSDAIEFPPQAVRTTLLREHEEQHERIKKALEEDVGPETMRWIEQASKRTHGWDKQLVRKQFADIARPYLVACCELGRELLGDLWDDRRGPQFMVSAINMFVQTTCPHCLMEEHDPALHVVDDP